MDALRKFDTPKCSPKFQAQGMLKMIIGLPTAKKPCEFIASSKSDLNKLPRRAKSVLTFAIRLAEEGKTHQDAKPLKGFGGAGVMEVVEDYDRNTYRAVYTLKFAGVVYVLDVFQKKSKKGKATPQLDINRINGRLKLAEQHYEMNYRQRRVGERS
jgi:phage-related protein